MITLNEQAQVDKWLEAEKNGEQFPVDFEKAWSMAGYSTKGNARRRLESELSLGIDFAFISLDKWSQQGRSSDLIVLTCDAFKHFCLMAKTEKGRAIRQYFIEAEKLLKDKMIPYCHQLTERIEKLEKELAAQRETKSESNFFVLGDVDTFYLCFKRGDNAVKLFTHKTEDIDHICKALNAVTQNMQPVTRLTMLNCK